MAFGVGVFDMEGSKSKSTLQTRISRSVRAASSPSDGDNPKRRERLQRLLT